MEMIVGIRYTSECYYKKWPGYLNVEIYKIPALWNKCVRTEEDWLRDQGVQEEKDEPRLLSELSNWGQRRIYKVLFQQEVF